MTQPFRPVPLDAYWGIIQSGARARLTTAQLWQAVRQSAEMAGETLAPGAFQRMNELRSLTGGQIRADRSLDRMAPSDAITTNNMYLDINSRPGFERALSPRYKVSFTVEGTKISDGSTVQVRLTDTFGQNLPATKQELLDTLGVEAPALAMDSDLVLGEITGDLSIRDV